MGMMPGKAEHWSLASLSACENRISDIWENLQNNNLWKHILKQVIATTVTVIICLIPGAKVAYGKAAYLAPITTVFGHPGRRFGMMAEALLLAVSGTILGVAWSIFGIYLSSLVIANNAPAAYAIRGVFLAIALMIHGFLRSHTPRLFTLVLLLIIVSVVSLTSPAVSVTSTLATQILYPILTAVGVLLLVNISIFPEFSSGFIGETTIETLDETVHTLKDAGVYFVEMGGAHVAPDKELGKETDIDVKANASPDGNSVPAPDRPPLSSWKRMRDMYQGRKSEKPEPESSPPTKKVSIKDLTAGKARLRSKLAGCKAAQQECNFELAYSCIPPWEMKPINDKAMKKLVANTIALLSACESKFALVGEVDDDSLGISEKNSHAQNRSPSEDQGRRGTDVSEIGQDSSQPETPLSEKDEENEVPKKERKARNHRRKEQLARDKEELELVKPKREIEFGDVQLLRCLVKRVSKPIEDFQQVLDRSAEVISACIAYAYGVSKLPSGAVAPKGIMLQELDIDLDNLEHAISDFDKNTAGALEGAVVLEELKNHKLDILPREEIFLIASFMLNLRQAAAHTLEMLQHSRFLVGQRQERHGRRRLYAPRINWKKWLFSGGDEDEALPASGRTSVRRGTAEDEEEDNETSSSSSQQAMLNNLTSRGIGNGRARNGRATTKKPNAGKSSMSGDATQTEPEHMSTFLRMRGRLADMLEWVQSSEDMRYAFKLTVAVFLVTWPAFKANWNTWYSLNRGLWAALQLVLISEVSLGTSVMTFMLRAFGTTVGCIWGWAAYEARDGNQIVCAAMIFIGIIPSSYIQLGTKYPKAGIVLIVSMCVVALATELKTVPGTATENFLKRWIAFIIGGITALLVQVILLPVKARDRLVESLAASIYQINEMEGCVAFGIEDEVNVNVYSETVMKRFERASGKAKGALAAAETFLPFCKNEPRLKGSFEGLALIYGEVLFVLHQIVDRMDNMLQLRTSYGSDILEEYNSQVFPYRRNVAASITIILFAVHEALTTKLPLPQFLPSARLAHLRMVNRVREVVFSKTHSTDALNEGEQLEISKQARRRAVKLNFMSWNAASAAQAEVIEYLEELIDLAKLLVGANEFRSGMLTRPTYRDYMEKIGGRPQDPLDLVSHTTAAAAGTERQERGDGGNVLLGLRNRKTNNSPRGKDSNENELPSTLKRIQSKKIEAKIEKRMTNESWERRHKKD
ncbi:MAG: hypothetical protein M1827_007247 [Pycnora praestabilis]|nr:MAG: hypothetical protein M1827_007247 [Pycnora praestabilis]